MKGLTLPTIFVFVLVPILGVFAQFPGDDTSRNNRQGGSRPTLDGFAEVAWESTYAQVREKFLSLATNPDSGEKVEIINEDKEKSLLIRRSGIFYVYRFYSTPKIVLDSRPKQKQVQTTPPPANEDEGHNEPGKLFSVGVSFRYLPGKEVQDKLENKYGKPKKETLDEKKIGGAAIWELTNEKEIPPRGGFIVQWKEAYKKQPFTRRVDYFSSKLKAQIEKEYKEFFSAEEIKTLRDLIP
ncbi:hypothetical protein LEP1GSC050_1162 [Leptospira broomii serovar Hurstbridge str. 5399]|uniref:Uncharacterized protein n=1 Tax=Leptospira broomii serovar Hurstbridge str. 5399 TaxID=1049789 RepID=T0GNF3_9LEPT|nr:hypothetical protein [Leptospira broomii]EQA46868.1 hypothetical protein LEP1GSC050_1162 [Leptospira broomii serovar Hurstbridge str. 5399]